MCCVSCVLCDMSCVTCHVSHVMCHMSPLTRHLSLTPTATAKDSPPISTVGWFTVDWSTVGWFKKTRKNAENPLNCIFFLEDRMYASICKKKTGQEVSSLQLFLVCVIHTYIQTDIATTRLNWPRDRCSENFKHPKYDESSQLA